MDANTFLIGFGMLVGAIVYWRKGGNKASNEANTALLQLNETSRLQMDTMKASIKGLEDREREQGKEIGRLQGILSEKEKQIAILQSVDIGKNPQLMNVLTEIKDFMHNINVHMQTNHAVL